MIRKALRWMKYKFLKIMRLKDGSDKIAKGVALGVAFNFLPTFGLGIFCALITAGLIGTNKMAAGLSCILIKFGIPLFYILNLAVGHLVLGEGFVADDGSKISMLHMQLSDLKNLGMPFLVGSIVNAVWTAILSYYLVLNATDRYKNSRLRKAKA